MSDAISDMRHEIVRQRHEIRHLRAENDRLRADMETLHNSLNKCEADNERLMAMVEDACKVLDHYDLSEHAWHYRNELATKAPTVNE